MLLGFISHQGNEPEWGKYTVDTKCWYDYRQHAIGRNIKLVRPLGGLHHSGWTWSVAGVWHFHFQEYGPQSTHRPSQKACFQCQKTGFYLNVPRQQSEQMYCGMYIEWHTIQQWEWTNYT